MMEKGLRRKLTAILSADVVGYSRLMGQDEISTIRTLKNYKEIMTKLIEHGRGRVVDAPGDNILAEFASVVDAVRCAAEIQRELAECNEDSSPECKMDFRIGVNLGDVVEEEGRIYGDGVNIAARMESLYEGGGVCISGTAFEHVENKLDLEFEDLGVHNVKNITKPVHVYRVLSYPGAAAQRVVEAKRNVQKKWRKATAFIAVVLIFCVGVAAIWYFYARPELKIEIASEEKMEFPLPELPSIAVLPFVNMSGDPEQEYFIDGFTEHIITSLSIVPYIFVIARNSSFAYKGKSAKIKKIAEDLGVRYALEGSIQRSNDSLRITVQLIDAIAGHHVWAENYDRKLKDIFALQDEIAIQIMAELQVSIAYESLGRSSSIQTKNLKTYEKYLKGYERFLRRTEEDTLHARKLAKEAIVLDPEYGAAYVLLGWTHLDDIWFHRTKDRAKSLQTADQWAQKAIDLTGQDTLNLRLLSSIFMLRKKYDKAIIEIQKAIELSPNSASSHFIYGMVLRYIGRNDEAISNLKKAIRLNPIAPIHYFNNLAWAYFNAEQYVEAIPLWNRTIQRNPDYLFAYEGLTGAYQLAGNEIKARESAAEVLRIKPTYSLAIIRRWDIEDIEIKKRVVEAYRKAGIPE